MAPLFFGLLAALLLLGGVARAQSIPNLPVAGSVSSTDPLAVWHAGGTKQATAAQLVSGGLGTAPGAFGLDILASTTQSGAQALLGLGSAAYQPTTAFDAAGAAAAAQAASLQKSSNLSDLASAATARTNLGLSGSGFATGAANAVNTSSGFLTGSGAASYLGLQSAAYQPASAFDAAGAAATAQAASLQKANNLSDLASAATARTNLGLSGSGFATGAANAVNTSSGFLTGSGAASYLGLQSAAYQPTTAFDAAGVGTNSSNQISGTLPSGRLSGSYSGLTLSSGQVTGALGYTPPTPTGSGASGTWGISISGNAATATTASTAPLSGLTGAGSGVLTAAANGVNTSSGFLTGSGAASYLGLQSAAYQPTTAFDAAGAAATAQSNAEAYSSVASNLSSGTVPAGRLSGAYSGLTLSSSQITGALGYTPPTPTGTGSSGTWGISISGNAATATTASGAPLSGLTGAGSGVLTAAANAVNTAGGLATSGGPFSVAAATGLTSAQVLAALGYTPLSLGGGTVTGPTTFSQPIAANNGMQIAGNIYASSNSSAYTIFGGTSGNGAYVELWGSASANPNLFVFGNSTSTLSGQGGNQTLQNIGTGTIVISNSAGFTELLPTGVFNFSSVPTVNSAALAIYANGTLCDVGPASSPPPACTISTTGATLAAGSTTTSGFSAGQLLYSDGTYVQPLTLGSGISLTATPNASGGLVTYGGTAGALSMTSPTITGLTTAANAIYSSCVTTSAEVCLNENPSFNTTCGADDTTIFNAGLATGKSVVFFGCALISSDLIQTTPSQIIRGQGRAPYSITSAAGHGSTIYAASNSGFTHGLLYVNTSGLAGPVIKDLAIQVQQVDTATRSSLTNWVPLIYAQNVPAMKLTGVGEFAGIVCLDARGNDGQLILDDVLMSCLGTTSSGGGNILVDGAYDTVYQQNVHIWPAALTANQETIFFSSGTIGLSIGGVSGMLLSNWFADAGTPIALICSASSTNAGAGQSLFMSSFGLEPSTGAVGISSSAGTGCSYGNNPQVTLASGYASLASGTTSAINEVAGSWTLGSFFVFDGNSSSTPEISLTDTNGTTNFEWTGGSVYRNVGDRTQVSVGGAATVAEVAHVTSVTSTNAETFTTPVYQTTSSGVSLRLDYNYISPTVGVGSGTFVSIYADGNHVVNNNIAKGWTFTVPTGTTTGIYTPNVK